MTRKPQKPRTSEAVRIVYSLLASGQDPFTGAAGRKAGGRSLAIGSMRRRGEVVFLDGKFVLTPLGRTRYAELTAP